MKQSNPESTQQAERKPEANQQAHALPFILVGTYRSSQFKDWSGFYNYPVSEAEAAEEGIFRRIREIWLFCGFRKQLTLSSEFIGFVSREELINKYGYRAGKTAHSPLYALFKTECKYVSDATDAKVIVRTKDFGRTPAIQRRLKRFLESSNRNNPDLADLLPEILLGMAPERLCVCENEIQCELFSWEHFAPIVKPKAGVPTAVELFAGAGGLSVGLENAGFQVVLANEIMPDFAATLKANHPGTNVIAEDIHKIDFRAELAKLGLEFVDVLSGGPPCQGFSTIGSKNKQDPRNSLFYEYLRAVAETNPKYTIFENVSGFKRMYGGFAYETLVRELSELGYDTDFGILNAADYGAPQIRLRTIVVGWKRGLPAVRLPKPTHGTGPGLKPFVTLMEAIGDLPPLQAGESVCLYGKPPSTEYQRRMRGTRETLLDHDAANYGAKMREILQTIPPGGSIKDLPQRLRPKSGYANTYARLLPDVPSPTITRNFGTPSSSRCVHPFQPRALSTREGARLQGFPDGYVFTGGKQSKNLQIGNAVPPILGEAVAKSVMRALKEGPGR